MDSRTPVIQQAEKQARALAEKAKAEIINGMVKQFGRQGESANVKLYLAAVKDCTPEQVAGACRHIVNSGTEFLPRPGLLRRAVEDAALGEAMRLAAWKNRAREVAEEEFSAFIREAEHRKESAIAAARAKGLSYDEFARLRDEAILACRAEIQRLEQARGRKYARIDALKVLPAPEAKAAIEG